MNVLQMFYFTCNHGLIVRWLNSAKLVGENEVQKQQLFVLENGRHCERSRR